MNQVGIAMGSNLGDRQQYLQSGLQHLARTDGIQVERISPLYETEPVGPGKQGRYLNGVLIAQTTLGAHELLNRLLEIEVQEERVRSAHRYAARTLDLDLLFYGEEVRDEDALTLPHPRLHERAFVLFPLRDLLPEWRHPRLKKNLEELIDLLADSGEIQPYSGGLFLD